MNDKRNYDQIYNEYYLSCIKNELFAICSNMNDLEATYLAAQRVIPHDTCSTGIRNMISNEPIYKTNTHHRIRKQSHGYQRLKVDRIN